MLCSRVYFWASCAFVLLYSVLLLCLIQIFPSAVDRGVACGDSRIDRPFKSDIISGLALVLLSILPVIVLLTIANYLLVLTEGRSEDAFLTKLLSVKSNLKACWKENVFLWLVYSGGTSTCYFLVEISKISIGAHRPHFISVCKPHGLDSWQAVDCTLGSLVYVADFNCTGDSTMVERSLKSLPSGHAAISFYCALFGIAYLQMFMAKFYPVCVAKTFFQILFLCIAWAISFSRIADNHHFVEDVVAGAVIGALLGYKTVEFCFPIQQFLTLDKESEMKSSDSASYSITKNNAQSNSIQTPSDKWSSHNTEPLPRARNNSSPTFLNSYETST